MDTVPATQPFKDDLDNPDRPFGRGHYLRYRLGEMQRWRCAYCGHSIRIAATGEHGANSNMEDVLSIDEIIPRRDGGERTYLNTVAACCSCNSARGDADAMEFVGYRMAIGWTGRGLPEPGKFAVMTNKKRNRALGLTKSGKAKVFTPPESHASPFEALETLK